MDAGAARDEMEGQRACARVRVRVRISSASSDVLPFPPPQPQQRRTPTSDAAAARRALHAVLALQGQRLLAAPDAAAAGLLRSGGGICTPCARLHAIAGGRSRRALELRRGPSAAAADAMRCSRASEAHLAAVSPRPPSQASSRVAERRQSRLRCRIVPHLDAAASARWLHSCSTRHQLHHQLRAAASLSAQAYRPRGSEASAAGRRPR
jgi:hypothetical protein